MLDSLEVIPGGVLLSTGILGLVIGSFLNVVIHRLPIMLKRSWRQDCEAFLEIDQSTRECPPELNLLVPRSHCPNCGRPIPILENIPILSFLWLRGRCSGCQIRIPRRYPATELLTATLSVAVVGQFGPTTQAIAALLLTWSLVVLGGIDLEHRLLPDSITQPILWLGLTLSILGPFADSTSAILGAAGGYLVLWSIYHLFKFLTGKEGMGYGDFKFLAMLGAWLGWQSLPLILILSSFVGTVVGVSMILLMKRDHRAPIPFGPFLASAGWIALLWGGELNAIYLGYFHLN